MGWDGQPTCSELSNGRPLDEALLLVLFSGDAGLSFGISGKN